MDIEQKKLELRRSPVANPQTLMKVRLLLLWAFADNVMDSHKNNVMKKSGLPTNAVGLSGPTLAKDQLKPLFPPAVKFELESTATHTIHASNGADRSYADSIVEMQAIVEALSPEMAVLIWKKEKICLSVREGSLEMVMEQLNNVVSGGAAGQKILYGKSPEMNRVQISVDASKAKIKALSWIKSRRGMGVHLTTLTLSVNSGGLSTMVCAGREPSDDEARQWFGPNARWTVQSGAATQTVVFPADAAGSAGSSPYIRDRALGLRILLGMAHGYKDSRLRLWDPNGTKDEDKIEIGLSLLPKRGSPGMNWEHDLGVALTGRHSPLTVAVDLVERPLYAVGSSVMIVGKDCVAVQNITLLPPGREWLSLALRCIGSTRDRPGDGHSGKITGDLHDLTELELELMAPLRAVQLRSRLALSMTRSRSAAFSLSNDLHEMIATHLNEFTVAEALHERYQGEIERADAIGERLTSVHGSLQRDDRIAADLIALLGPHCGVSTTPVREPTDDGGSEEEVDDHEMVAFLIGALASAPGGKMARSELRKAVEDEGFPASVLKRSWLEETAGVFVIGGNISLTKVVQRPDSSGAGAGAASVTQVTKTNAMAKEARSWHCPECDIRLQDSVRREEHNEGKRHRRAVIALQARQRQPRNTCKYSSSPHPSLISKGVE